MYKYKICFPGDRNAQFLHSSVLVPKHKELINVEEGQPVIVLVVVPHTVAHHFHLPAFRAVPVVRQETLVNEVPELLMHVWLQLVVVLGKVYVVHS